MVLETRTAPTAPKRKPSDPRPAPKSRKILFKKKPASGTNRAPVAGTSRSSSSSIKTKPRPSQPPTNYSPSYVPTVDEEKEEADIRKLSIWSGEWNDHPMVYIRRMGKVVNFSGFSALYAAERIAKEFMHVNWDLERFEQFVQKLDFYAKLARKKGRRLHRGEENLEQNQEANWTDDEDLEEEEEIEEEEEEEEEEEVLEDSSDQDMGNQEVTVLRG